MKDKNKGDCDIHETLKKMQQDIEQIKMVVVENSLVIDTLTEWINKSTNKKSYTIQNDGEIMFKFKNK